MSTRMPRGAGRTKMCRASYASLHRRSSCAKSRRPGNEVHARAGWLRPLNAITWHHRHPAAPSTRVIAAYRAAAMTNRENRPAARTLSILTVNDDARNGASNFLRSPGRSFLSRINVLELSRRLTLCRVRQQRQPRKSSAFVKRAASDRGFTPKHDDRKTAAWRRRSVAGRAGRPNRTKTPRSQCCDPSRRWLRFAAYAATGRRVCYVSLCPKGPAGRWDRAMRRSRHSDVHAGT